MKNIFLVLIVLQCTLANAQYFQRTFNFDYATPRLRDEHFNSGIRTRENYASGSTANYYHVGIGTSFKNSALASPYNRADWVRFVRVSKSGATVNTNSAFEFKSATTNKQYNAGANSIAEVSDGAGTGGYIAVGGLRDDTITGATLPGGSDALFVRLKSGGAVHTAWRIDFGPGDADVAWCVRSSSFMPGTMLVCGQTIHFPSGAPSYMDCWVARIDTAGTIIWSSTYNFDPTVTGNSPTANCAAKQLCEDPTTGDIYVVGFLTDLSMTSGTDGLIFKLSSAGAFAWSFIYNLSAIDYTTENVFQAVRWASTDEIIVGGFTNFDPMGGPFWGVLLLKVSPAGAINLQELLQPTDGDNLWQSKCFDLIERTRTDDTPQYFLFGPKYVNGLIHQLVIKTESDGTPVTSYFYNLMNIDYGFGIDYADNSFSKPALSLFSSQRDGTISDSHMMTTYFNGASCTNNCYSYFVQRYFLTVNPTQLQPVTTSTCAIVKIKSTKYAFDDALTCNQKKIACGDNDRLPDGSDELYTQELNVYPNPAGDVLNISWNNLQSGKINIEVVDVNGRILINQSENLEEGEISHQIDLHQLQHGFYIVRIISGNGTMWKPFIHQ